MKDPNYNLGHRLISSVHLPPPHKETYAINYIVVGPLTSSFFRKKMLGDELRTIAIICTTTCYFANCIGWVQ